MSNCRAVELLNQIAAKMSVLDDALVIVNGVIERREKNRKYMRKIRASRSSVVDTQTIVDTHKENENEKENLPPTPPIREKEKAKEKDTHNIARARDKLPFGNDPKVLQAKKQRDRLPKHPTWDEVWTWIKSHDPIKYPEAVVREWFDEREFTGWRKMNGEPVGNWQYDLQCWKIYLPARKRNANPDQKPDERKRNNNTFHADNWRGTDKEDLEDVL